MIAVLGLEAIGDDAPSRLARIKAFGDHRQIIRAMTSPRWRVRRPWVARIAGRDARFGLRREFLRYQKDYAEANGTGSRGVFLWFHLDEGALYEVRELTSWNGDRRYFATARASKVVELSRDEVDQWLAANAG